MEQYIWLKLYLLQKENVEMNGLESYIKKLLEINKNNYLPLLQS